ncbi:MAG: nickel pincer cofactor biosynthesis protein LarB [Pirellulaceae bacterium]
MTVQPNPEIEQWVSQARAGELTWTAVAERLLRIEQSASAHQPDADRGRRCRFGEVIFGEGKSPAAIAEIARRLLDRHATGQSNPADSQGREVLATRVPAADFSELESTFAHTRYDALGRTLRISDHPITETNLPPCPTPPGTVTVVTAGSTDRPIACEALETLRWMGVPAQLISDVGVAGPYRLLPHLDALRQSVALVVIAGMEGALASVVGGLVPCPVVAVPTSVGYGANFEGITTLLSMLSSCAAGVTVVNIDAGFKGGYVAGLIATSTAR